ncbi:MAG: hypothetical protein QXZ20_00070 [Candidatus Aenigmatarchaeota archaeon]
MKNGRKAYIASFPIGHIALDESGSLILFKDFRIDKNEFLEELNKMGYEIIENDFAKGIGRKNIRKIAIVSGAIKDDEEFNKILIEFGIKFSESKMKIEREKIVIRAYDILTTIEKFYQPFKERFKELCWFYSPTTKLSDEELENILNKIKKSNFEKEFGIKIIDKDKKILKELEDFINLSKKIKNEIEKYTKEEIKQIAPNLSYVAGDDIALMLLSHAGSLKNLAKMSASTIQLLGSEKALFRHLKNRERVKPPKHGLIYNSPYIKNAPKEYRGKIARILASKIALAAKIDFYSQRDERERLKKELEEEISKVIKNG